MGCRKSIWGWRKNLSNFHMELVQIFITSVISFYKWALNKTIASCTLHLLSAPIKCVKGFWYPYEWREKESARGAAVTEMCRGGFLGEGYYEFVWVSRDKSSLHGLLMIWEDYLLFECVRMFEGCCAAILDIF